MTTETFPRVTYRVREFCAITGMKASTCYALLNRGELPGVKRGGGWYVAAEAIDLVRPPTDPPD